MGNSLFDYSDSDIAYSVSDNMAINSNGDYLMRMGGRYGDGYADRRAAYDL